MKCLCVFVVFDTSIKSLKNGINVSVAMNKLCSNTFH
jgi:hypothetical protein